MHEGRGRPARGHAARDRRRRAPDHDRVLGAGLPQPLLGAGLDGDGDGNTVTIDADKSWVTAAADADSYVTAVRAPGATDPLVTELFLVDAGTPGIEILGPFDGLGMRGNGSSPVRFTVSRSTSTGVSATRPADSA